MSEKLKELCEKWLAAKRVENAATAARLAVEVDIIAVTGHRPEGSKTHDTELGLKVEVTGNINRKMDWKAWALIKDDIPAELHPVKNKPEVDDAGCRWLQENKPDLYALLPLTVTPGKTGVSVKEPAPE